MNKIAKYCNCTKEEECPKPTVGNHECCSENVPNGNPTFGLWVEKNHCDHNKGFSKNAHKHNNNLPVEKFMSSGYREGYNDKDNKWIAIAIIIALIFGASIYLKFRRDNLK